MRRQKKYPSKVQPPNFSMGLTWKLFHHNGNPYTSNLKILHKKIKAHLYSYLFTGKILHNIILLIKSLTKISSSQEGEIKLPDYDYVIAHPNILTELVPIRGLMKRRFPNLRSGTLEADISGLVKKLAKGVQYKAVKDEHQQNFASMEVPIGRVSGTDQLGFQ